MRLTMSPLPPAVYWRRRVVVLAALLVVVAAVVYSCTGGSCKGGRNRVLTPTSGSASPEMSASASVSASGPAGGGIPDQDGGGQQIEPSSPAASATPGTGQN